MAVSARRRTRIPTLRCGERVCMRTFGLLLTTLALVACARHDALDRGPVTLERQETTVEEDVRFSPSDWPQALYADIHRPRSERDDHPAVLVVHGGGWERRSRADMTATARRLAGWGFVAVNIDYRFAPEYQFPAQLHDVQIALNWMRGHADELRIDPERIGALGFSSGGHLVSLAAMVAGQGGELDRAHGGERTRPLAVVSGGTPSDLRKFPGGELVPQFLGGRLDAIPEVFAAASPVVHVHADAPPVFLYHGGMDPLVPPDHATDFYAELVAQGVPAELYILRLRGHVTAFLTSHTAIRRGAEFLHHFATLEEATD